VSAGAGDAGGAAAHLKMAKSWIGPTPTPLNSLFSSTVTDGSKGRSRRRSSLPEGRDLDAYALAAQSQPQGSESSAEKSALLFNNSEMPVHTSLFSAAHKRLK
jgi:hypothetical protein